MLWRKGIRDSDLVDVGKPLLSYDDKGFPLLVGICIEALYSDQKARLPKFINISDYISCIKHKIKEDMLCELQQFNGNK